jgi:hypothetical protein
MELAGRLSRNESQSLYQSPHSGNLLTSLTTPLLAPLQSTLECEELTMDKPNLSTACKRPTGWTYPADLHGLSRTKYRLVSRWEGNQCGLLKREEGPKGPIGLELDRMLH